VLASLRPPSSEGFIPTIPSQFVSDELNLLNHETLASSVIFRALAVQQKITNTVHEYHDKLFRKAAAKAPLPAADLAVDSLVLIEWSGKDGASPPSKLHPSLRGPYIIKSIRDNTLSLQHLHFPSPPNQPSELLWSKRARAYECEMDFDRSAYDPAAAQVPLNASAFGIDCILSHDLRKNLPRATTSRDDFSTLDARYQLYEVRYHHSTAPHFLRVAWRPYEDIAHTMAMDSYTLGNPRIHSHLPISAMPSSWSNTTHKTGSSQSRDPVRHDERNINLRR
jgi:hypothetical protein